MFDEIQHNFMIKKIYKGISLIWLRKGIYKNHTANTYNGATLETSSKSEGWQDYSLAHISQYRISFKKKLEP